MSSNTNIMQGLDFGRALCAHFGLPPNQVDSGIAVHADDDEIFGVTVRISLTPNDLAGIAGKMAEQRKG